MTNYIDVHTHLPPSSNDITISNIDPRSFKLPELDNYFSFGLHPWWIEQVDMHDYQKTRLTLINNKNFLALGEIGLDFSIECSRKVQEEVFFEHLVFANKHSIKVIIVHCVRAYNEIARLVKKAGYSGAVIFHDYNANIETTKALLNLNVYFSFGGSLFKNGPKGINSFKIIPLERVFLETDEAKQYNIYQVHDQACQLLAISLEKLLHQIKINFTKCFSREIE